MGGLNLMREGEGIGKRRAKAKTTTDDEEEKRRKPPNQPHSRR